MTSVLSNPLLTDNNRQLRLCVCIYSVLLFRMSEIKKNHHITYPVCLPRGEKKLFSLPSQPRQELEANSNQNSNRTHPPIRWVPDKGWRACSFFCYSHPPHQQMQPFSPGKNHPNRTRQSCKKKQTSPGGDRPIWCNSLAALEFLGTNLRQNARTNHTRGFCTRYARRYQCKKVQFRNLCRQKKKRIQLISVITSLTYRCRHSIRRTRAIAALQLFNSSHRLAHVVLPPRGVQREACTSCWENATRTLG